MVILPLRVGSWINLTIKTAILLLEIVIKEMYFAYKNGLKLQNLRSVNHICGGKLFGSTTKNVIVILKKKLTYCFVPKSEKLFFRKNIWIYYFLICNRGLGYMHNYKKYRFLQQNEIWKLHCFKWFSFIFVFKLVTLIVYRSYDSGVLTFM